MNKLGVFFIICMILGLVLFPLSMKFKHGVIIAFLGYVICMLAAVGYALNLHYKN